ncbi:MAG: GTP-binding protein [Patescibacteria group bacterium]
MLPIIIINGPLGSGKTTLIHSLLTNYIDPSKTLWIKTEFGEESIDQYLLQDTNVQTKDLTGGCVCHVLISQFDNLLSQIEPEESIDQIIVETSGMSHPEPVIQVIERHPHYSVAHIALVVDTVHAGDKSYPTPMKVLPLPYNAILFNKYPNKLTPPEEADLDEKLDPWYENNLVHIEKLYCYDSATDTKAYNKSIAEWYKIISEDITNAFNKKPRTLKAQKKEIDPEDVEDHEGELDVVVLHLPKDQSITKEQIELYAAKLPEEVVRVKGVFHINSKWEFYNWTRGNGNWTPLTSDANGQLLLVMGHDIEQIDSIKNVST